MSGSAPNLPIKLTLDGMPEVERGLARVGQTAQTALTGAGTAATTASGGMGRFNQAIQQGGYSLQDFTVQVQGGQSALVALSQQGSQFLGIFGPAGAAAGAILSISTVAIGFLTASENAKEAEKAGKAAFENMATAATQLKGVLQEVNGLFLSNAERSAASANAARDELQTRTQTLLTGAVQRNEGNVAELSEARAYLSRLEEYASRQEEVRARLRASGQMSPEGEALTDRGNLFQARARVQGLEQDIERTSTKIGEMNELLKRVGNSGRVGVEEYGPTSADPGGVNALRASLDKKFAAEQAYQAKVTEINAKLREERIGAADADRLTTLATNERDEAIKRLDDSTKKTAVSTRELNAAAEEARRIFSTLQRDGTTGLLYGTASDDDMAREIKRAIKGSAIDPDVIKRAEKEQERANERAQDRLDRTAERWGDTMARETYSALEGAFDKSKSPAEAAAAVFGSALRTAAQAALSQVVFQPAIAAVLGSPTQSSTIAGAGASGSGTNVAGLAGQASTAYSAWDKITNINPGKYMAPGYAYNTGWSGADSILNTSIGDAGGTIGTYGAGALGIAGGAYAAYTGIQRGGVGGYTQAAGGAATAGLSAAAMYGMTIPVYGWIAAAALMVLGALLPGQKPSDRTGTATFYTNDPTNPLIGGLDGDRYSGENRDQARAIGDQLMKVAQNVADVTDVVGGRVETAYRVAVGARDGLNVYFGEDRLHGGMDEEGVNAVTKAFVQRILTQAAEQTTDANIRSVILRGGVEDPDATLANIDWYKTAYKGLSDTLDITKINSYTKAQDALKEQYGEISDKATSLGLSLEPVTAALSKGLKDLDEARIASFNNTIQGMDLASMQLRGGNMLGPQLNAFDTQRNTDWKALVLSILDQGFGQDQINIAQGSFDALRDLQRKSIVDQDAAARAASSNSLWDRIQSASGNGDTLEGAKWDYERRAQTEWAQAVADGMTDLTLLAKAQNEERLAIERRFNQEAMALDAQRRDQAQESVVSTLGGITDFIRSMQLDGSSLLSPEAKLDLLGRDFNDVASRAANGDYDAISEFTSVASSYRSAARDYYGSSAGFGMVQGQIASVAESIAGMSSDTLTASSFASITRETGDNIATRVVDAIQELLTETRLARLERQGLERAR
jgi:hypothetical protein